MSFEDSHSQYENRFATAPLKPIAYDHIRADNPLVWVDQARRLLTGENYHSHPLLHKGFVYTPEEIQNGPWMLIQLGDSYASGFLNNTENENGESEHYPHGKIVADRLSEGLETNVLYINKAVGGSVIKDAAHQLRTYENPEQFDTTLHRELIISTGGNDAFNTTAGDTEFTSLLEEFINNPLSRKGIRPLPTALFTRINVITAEYRDMLYTLTTSPNVDLVKRVTFSLLPNAKHIDRHAAYMENVNLDQRAAVRQADEKNKKLTDHFYMTGTEVINAILLSTIDDFFNKYPATFDINVIDTFAVLDAKHYRGEHPTREGHDELAEHYLERCFKENEVVSLANKLWVPASARRPVYEAA